MGLDDLNIEASMDVNLLNTSWSMSLGTTNCSVFKSSPPPQDATSIMKPLTHLNTSSARLKHQLTEVISSVRDMVRSKGIVSVVTPHNDAVFRTLK